MSEINITHNSERGLEKFYTRSSYLGQEQGKITQNLPSEL